MSNEMINDVAQLLASQLQGPVALLLGGHSAEREISLQSGEAVYQALKAKNIAAEKIDTKNDDWLERVAKFKHAFIALHGGDGENGNVQAELEKIGLSYTGSGVAASAKAMDKVHCKKIWEKINLSTPSFVELTEDSDWVGIIQQWGTVIIKPATEGSSIGMAVANTAEQLAAAYQQAKPYGSLVMAEQWVSGAEFTVAILGDKPLPPIKLETDHGFYNYDAKYIAEDTRYICPCGLSAEKEQELQQLALAAFDSVGCKGWGRVDVMQNEQGQFYLLEVNTVPGMTSHSLVPMAAKAAGLSFADLVLKILQLSIAEAKN
ncbi:D-alanine--D-alanine ligase [Oceanicoccus sp. KOV_DT_Chl]|uniref:D-alanine--D-alanine ligase n=1 Tax=Oceanicoccus sp. KOV_DT_Chl TaxID=1904639 RepID=UPI000C7A19AF|nr:D-alanine--D-alanine ligase [Oceanicoccus sp. KOV_DT_Chl]